MKPNRNPYLVNLIVCWVYLAISVIITLSGSNYFSLDETLHPEFSKFCTFLDTNVALKVILSAITGFIGNILLIKCILNTSKLSKIQKYIFIPISILTPLSGWVSQILQIVLNVLFFTIPVVYLKRKFYRIPIGIALIIAIQQGLMFIRTIGNWYLNSITTTYAGFTLQLDFIIITVMYYLYFTKKEVK